MASGLPPRAAWCAICAACLICGCLSMNTETAGVGEAQLEYYHRVASRIDFTTEDFAPNHVQAFPAATRGLRPPTPAEYLDLTLFEAVQMGLRNSSIIRQNAQFLSPGNPLLTNPDNVPSIFDIAIQDNGVLFGNRGVPAALADYDPKFSTSLIMARDENVQNSQILSGGLPPGTVLTANTGNFDMRLDQPLMSGGTLSLVHNWDYRQDNVPLRLFQSAYTGSLGTEFRQPLWAGFGPMVNGVAGQVRNRSLGVTGVNQGVVIAQINTRLSQLDFERQVQDMVHDIGSQYWDLFSAYREYAAEASVRDKAKLTWDEVRSKLKRGLPGGAAVDEAQAEEVYLDSEARVESSLANLYSAETRLRRLLGMPAEDGQVLRPVDSPTLAPPPDDRVALLQSAYVYRLELRRQKSQIESLSLQLQAARNLANPKLDFVASYKLNGFGADLYNQNTADGITPRGYNSAYSTLFQGQQASWSMGFEFSVPLYLRAERSQIRQLELRLMKARRALESQELEVGHEVYAVLQALDRWNRQAALQAKRREASNRRLTAATTDFEVGRTTGDQLLRSEQSFYQAEIAYQKSLAEYAKSVLDLNYRTGQLLASYHVELQSPLDSIAQSHRPEAEPPQTGTVLRELDKSNG